MSEIIIHNGDNRPILKEFPDASFDSCVCDPPYELGFMGKKWDSSGISYSVAMWREVWRVLKPGAHLLAFGGSRTYHRLACAIEDAGFQIRDQIMWLYGSGFPKSLDISRALDKAAGAERTETIVIDRYKDGKVRQNLGPVGNLWPHANGNEKSLAASPLAQHWDGWGTALKPAHEPIVVARKPLDGTVVKNVVKWGCGAINVASCRIEVNGERLGGGGSTLGKKFNQHSEAWRRPWMLNENSREASRKRSAESVAQSEAFGRWPANVIHDGSDEVLAEFAKSGELRSGAFPGRRHAGARSCFGNNCEMDTGIKKEPNTGTAARFFYCAKASQEERNLGYEGLPELSTSTYGEFPDTDNPRQTPRGINNTRRNNHPTVKPLALMAYLVRLVTPPGGVVLDPFMGSGSTLIAAAKEGFDAVGIDLEAENCELSERRIRGHLGMLVNLRATP